MRWGPKKAIKSTIKNYSFNQTERGRGLLVFSSWHFILLDYSVSLHFLHSFEILILSLNFMRSRAFYEQYLSSTICSVNCNLWLSCHSIQYTPWLTFFFLLWWLMKYFTHLWRFSFHQTDFTESLRLTEVRIPNHVIRNNTVKLECHFDMNGEQLYSVKWYKDGYEFYRYVPRWVYSWRKWKLDIFFVCFFLFVVNFCFIFILFLCHPQG